MSDNILVNKSFKFAVRIINLYKYLCDNKKEFIGTKLQIDKELISPLNENWVEDSKNEKANKGK